MYTIYLEDSTQELFNNEDIKSRLVQHYKMTPTEASIAIGDSRLESRPVRIPSGILTYWTKVKPTLSYNELVEAVIKREESLEQKTLISSAKKPKSLASFKPLIELSAPTHKTVKPTKEPIEFGINYLASQLSTEPKKIRKALRSLGIEKEGSNYSWPNEEATTEIVNKLKKKLGK